MRRIDEGPDLAPSHSGAGALAPMPLRQVAPFFAFALACYLVAPYIGLGSREVDWRIAEIWPPGGVGFVLLTVIWHSGRRVVGATLAVMVLAFTITAVTLDFAPATALWLALTGVAQSWLMVMLYRRRLKHTGWAPRSPDEVAALLLAAVVSSVLLGIVGGYPFLSTGDLPSEVLLWWVLRNTVFCFVGAVTFMVMFHGRKSDILPVSSWVNRIGLIGTAVACVYGTYLDPSLPLSWLLIVPSVWGGLTLTVRGTAYLAITVALLAAAMTYLPQNRFGYHGILPAAAIIDLLVIASTAFMFLLVLLREQRGRLIAELDRKGAESEAQRQMLETVFESMKDGVVIVEDTKVTMHNTAARQLLGRPIPATQPDSWAETFGVKDADGVAFDEDALREGLAAAENGRPAKTLEVRIGQGDSARILDVSAQPLGDGTKHSTIVLLHEVTSQRARLRELSNFAGMVAHDLRGPLTVLDGWLEVVQDDADSGEALLYDDALVKARDASKRMRQVIDDWLNYTVVQNGQLFPDAVKLDEVATEIVESRQAHWAEGDQPLFMRDLMHVVQADPAMLRQLLDNLIGNAIKYTAPDQAPWVQLTSAQDAEPGWVRVEVTDHGVGVPEGQEELIFEEFHRGPIEGRSAGTGLGLALTRRIVAMHGGELKARRNPEGGSTFSFTLREA